MTRKLLWGLMVLGWIPTLMFAAGMKWLSAEHVEAQERTPIKVTRIYTGVQFRRTSPDYFIDWHTTPRRQYVITLAGESEVEIGDGTKIRLHPDHILLAEDVEGQGHISRAVGSRDRISLFLPLAEQ